MQGRLAREFQMSQNPRASTTHASIPFAFIRRFSSLPSSEAHDSAAEMELQLPLRPAAAAAETDGENTTAAPNASSKSPLLRLPPSVRRRIYILAGVPQNRPILLDKPWKIDYTKKVRPDCCALPKDAYDMRSDMSNGIANTHHLLLTCLTISTEVAALLYSTNDFITQDPKPLAALNPVSLGHLRSLRIVINCSEGHGRFHTCMSHYPRRKIPPGPSTDEGRALLAMWDQLARTIGPHISPGLLTLTLICEVARDGKTDVHIVGARAVLASLAHFPPLASCHIRLAVRRDKRLVEMARAAAENATVRRLKQFRFADLPVEIRLNILRFTDLVAPKHIALHWGRSGGFYPINTGGDPIHKKRCGVSDIGCLCSWEHAVYSPNCHCWRDTRALLLVDRATLTLAREVFLRYHTFNVGYAQGERHWEEYPGTAFFRTVVPRSCWHLLRSLKISSNQIPWNDPKHHGCLNWWSILKKLKHDRSLALRFLRLNHLASEAEGILPSFTDLEKMTTTEKFKFVRNLLHGKIWPLDDGVGACLPLGTRHLEFELYSSKVSLKYRIRDERYPLSRYYEAMSQDPKKFESRLLLGGRLPGDVGKGDDVGDNDPANWIEEVAIEDFQRRRGGLGIW
ncbi:hypothetical protein F5X68DRAFT_264046 [Plectosphaerella plurivora]|uniref:Uncharacterized protein n=1 Tax=Plectosphaerella plurivora TaxID=936078 RepID=A0A9P8V5I3_9PEZI|nr:hypothetical protein F5X68DRAFT_264046 [Plectosphaerella plurivora]